jgi:hypothetical protein
LFEVYHERDTVTAFSFSLLFQDFELPPLPAKPQKNLFSFFGAKNPKNSTQKNKKCVGNKQTSMKEIENGKQITVEDENESSDVDDSPIKKGKKKHRKRCIDDNDEENEVVQDREIAQKLVTKQQRNNIGSACSMLLFMITITMQNIFRIWKFLLL